MAACLSTLSGFLKVLIRITFPQRRDEARRRHPCLCAFDKLQQQERLYNVTMALENLKTILALHYNIGYESLPEGTRMKTIKLAAS